MSRWGKPTKNKRRGNPRYHLNEGDEICQTSDGTWTNICGSGDQPLDQSSPSGGTVSSGGEPAAIDRSGGLPRDEIRTYPSRGTATPVREHGNTMTQRASWPATTGPLAWIL